MKIGIFTDTYFPEVNGVANSAYQLKNELEKIGHTVYVFTVTNPEAPKDEHNVYRLKSVPFVFLKERRVSYSLTRMWLNKIRSLHLDLIHTQTEFSLGHMGRKLSEYLDIPMVHTYHTIYEDYTHYIKVPGSSKLKKVVKTFSRHCCNHAEKVIVPSMKVKDLLEMYGVNRDIIVQPTGVDFSKFNKIDENSVSALKEKYEFTDEMHVLVAIGRVSQEKNLMEIIEYLPKLVQADPMVRLAIVGDGPQREELEEKVWQLRLEQYVTFTGMVPWDEIQNYYAMGNAFICASTSETQGLTYIEALASGRPILVRADKCLEGVLQEGINGYSYEDKAQFVKKYMSMFENGRNLFMAENARASIEYFSAESFAANVEQIYEDVLEGWDDEREEVRSEKSHQLVG